MTDFHWSVISARRPGNVPLMMERTEGVDLYWYVTEEDVDNYRAAGAEHVLVGGNLCESRNLAIDDAQGLGLPCVELSDDLRRVKRKEASGALPEITVMDAAEEIWTQMSGLGARLGGCSPTSNAYFAHNEVKLAGFVVGDFIVVGDTDLRFDEEMTLKEDYDYTCQHLARYGLVARCDLILAEFAHRSNAGGAVAYRTGERERDMIRHLMKKWPGKFRMNPKRANEVILRW